jgi:hypothetical protein
LTSSKPELKARGVAAGRIGDAPIRSAEYDHLGMIIGQWITEGYTINPDGTAGSRIIASDVYQWAPGGFFVLHSAYGRIGDGGGGGIEIIGYDPVSHHYPVYFFDSLGNATRHHIIIDDRTWIWRGEFTRCTGSFSADGRTLMAHHERTDDGVTWSPSMEVILRKVE